MNMWIIFENMREIFPKKDIFAFKNSAITSEYNKGKLYGDRIEGINK